jgi:hypothetical protein
VQARGVGVSKETAMSMLTNLPRDPAAASSRGIEAGALLMKLRRLLNRWVAGVIARRERQAELAARRFGSIDPDEFGIYRYQADSEPATPPQGLAGGPPVAPGPL